MKSMIPFDLTLSELKKVNIKLKIMITGNEPAMPIWFEGNLGQMNSTGGLTIRQHFTVMAMQGFFFVNPPDKFFANQSMDWIAEHSVIMADKLIAELNKE